MNWLGLSGLEQATIELIGDIRGWYSDPVPPTCNTRMNITQASAIGIVGQFDLLVSIS